MSKKLRVEGTTTSLTDQEIAMRIKCLAQGHYCSGKGI